ncbi:MAG: hypothetical protein M3Z98_09050 [Candidatus Dormibacteraeota bacterium]|nr:hypothetical protein [Candidatus Dormibacteraeota bacterium]
MAVTLEGWNRPSGEGGAIAQPVAQGQVLSLEERRARLQRRRRVSRTQAALTAVVWLAGSGAVAFVAIAGMFGLR